MLMAFRGKGGDYLLSAPSISSVFTLQTPSWINQIEEQQKPLPATCFVCPGRSGTGSGWLVGFLIVLCRSVFLQHFCATEQSTALTAIACRGERTIGGKRNHAVVGTKMPQPIPTSCCITFPGLL